MDIIMGHHAPLGRPANDCESGLGDINHPLLFHRPRPQVNASGPFFGVKEFFCVS